MWSELRLSSWYEWYVTQVSPGIRYSSSCIKPRRIQNFGLLSYCCNSFDTCALTQPGKHQVQGSEMGFFINAESKLSPPSSDSWPPLHPIVPEISAKFSIPMTLSIPSLKMSRSLSLLLRPRGALCTICFRSRVSSILCTWPKLFCL